ncbi:MAG: type II secretion system protein GspG [Deltaproteobacteria bacterium]|nr:type II secretion system protein GspG [Deltaproteobacteria bacterium]
MPSRHSPSPLRIPWKSRWAQLFVLVSGPWLRITPWLLLLFALLFWMVKHAERQYRIRHTRVIIDKVHRAISAFRLDFGRCPASMTELLHPPRSGVRYLDEAPKDAWGRPLWIRCPARYDENDADVVSAGPSGNFLIDDNVW